jgi:hypothetical protein
MALPRPALLAVVGAMLAMLSFTVMRTIGARSGDVGVPGPSTQSVATQSPAAKPAKAAPEPAPKLEDVPPAVADALASGKVVVVLFTKKGGADDAASAGSFGAVTRLGGVRAFRAGLDDLRRYAGIVAQVGVTQAPSIVIVRPDLKAVPPIEGYVDSQYLLQRVKDQLR